MFSVTNVIQTTKQPRGGYIPPKSFSKTLLSDNEYLYSDENVDPKTVGVVVDYLTRYMISHNATVSFDTVLLAAAELNQSDEVLDKLLLLKGLDDTSIKIAVSLIKYDTYYRSGLWFDINKVPDTKTIHNIRILVNRCLHFFDLYGPVELFGFDFEGGYTDIISSGDGDYLTEDTLWDLKVRRSEITSQHTLQVCIYYLMGVESVHCEFSSIRYLGFYNPRMNKVYRLDINDISDEVLATISGEIIMQGYSAYPIRRIIEYKNDQKYPECAAKKVKSAFITGKSYNEDLYIAALSYDRFLLDKIPLQLRTKKVCCAAFDYNSQFPKPGYTTLNDCSKTQIAKLLKMIPEDLKEEMYCELIKQIGIKGILNIPKRDISNKIMLVFSQSDLRKCSDSDINAIIKYTPKEYAEIIYGTIGALLGIKALPLIPREMMTEYVLTRYLTSDPKKVEELLSSLPDSIKIPQQAYNEIAKYGTNIRYVPKEFRTEETYLNAIEANASNITRVPKDNRNTEFYKKALKRNIKAIKKIPNIYLNDELILEFLLSDNQIIDYIPKNHPKFSYYFSLVGK